MLVFVGFKEKVAASGCTALFAVLRDGEMCSNRSCLKHIFPFFFFEQGSSSSSSSTSSSSSAGSGFPLAGFSPRGG